MKFNRSVFGKAAAVALVLAAAGTASVAQARGNVFFSVNANVAPGVNIGVSNGGYGVGYYQPYAAPVYYQSAPVYYEPAPVVYSAPVYVGPRPLYYGNYYGHRHFRHARPVAYVRY